MSVKGSRGQVEIRQEDVRQLEESPEDIVARVEEIRRNILEKFSSKLKEVESDLENSTSFESVRLFSEFPPGDGGKPRQLIAASMVYQDMQDSRGVADSFLRRHSGSEKEELKMIAEHVEEIRDERDRFFLSGDASYYPSEDVLILQHVTSDLLDMQPRIEDVPKVLDPLIGYVFSGEVGLEDLKDTAAHELTHSWLQKNSMKEEVEASERMKAVEESFAYFAGWTQSGRKPTMDELRGSKTPMKARVVWATGILVDKSRKDGTGIDWAREIAAEIYRDFSEGEGPFAQLLRKAILDRDIRRVKKFRGIVEDHLKPVLQELESAMEEVEDEEFGMSEKIAARRIEQVHENFDWENPSKAEERILEGTFSEAVEQGYSLEELEKATEKAIRDEAEIVEEYAEKVRHLEEKIPVTDSLEKLDEAIGHLREVGKELESLA